MKRLEARGKGILLLHDIQARTAAALPKILHDDEGARLQDRARRARDPAAAGDADRSAGLEVQSAVRIRADRALAEGSRISSLPRPTRSPPPRCRISTRRTASCCCRPSRSRARGIAAPCRCRRSRHGRARPTSPSRPPPTPCRCRRKPCSRCPRTRTPRSGSRLRRALPSPLPMMTTGRNAPRVAVALKSTPSADAAGPASPMSRRRGAERMPPRRARSLRRMPRRRPSVRCGSRR